MPDPNERIIGLLEQLVSLQNTANERQQQALAVMERQYAEARARSEHAIELQTIAVRRQRWFVRVWLALIVFVAAAIVGLLWAVSGYLR